MGGRIKKQLNVLVEPELPRLVRVRAAEEGRKPADVVTDALAIYLSVPAIIGPAPMPRPENHSAA